MPKKDKKIAVVIGEPLSEDILSTDGSIVLCKKGTVVTRELIVRLSNWIIEEEPRQPREKKVRLITEGLRQNIIKKLEFEEIVSKKTRQQLEKGATDFFENIKSRGNKASISLVEDSIASLVEETPDNPDVSLKLSEMKRHSSDIYRHSIECGVIASFVATALNYSQQEVSSLALAMMLHDTGKLRIPEDLLQKKSLTAEEWEEICNHPKYGWDMLKEVPGMDPLALMVTIGHHRNADGTGYPQEVDFNELPGLVHLSAIIDRFEALTSDKPYRPAFHMHEAIEIIISEREKYHLGAIENFVGVVGIYPITTFLQLSTGEVGVVVRNNPENLFLPEVKLVLDPGGKPYSKDIVVNLLNEPVRKVTRVVDKV